MPQPLRPEDAPLDAPVRLTAGCKINLGLAITGRLENGYHTLRSVFWPLPEPHDTIVVRRRRDGGIRVATATPGIDCGHNTLTRAWRAFAEATGFAPALDVELVKGIPWGAGLGGGSCDAAKLLRHLQGLPDAPAVGEEELAAMAARIGADVPFFLQDRPMLVTGIGDRLEPCEIRLPGPFLLLVTPDVQVATPWAYQAYDRLSDEERAAEPDPAAGPFANDLEKAVFPAFPELARIKQALLGLGAAAASMSGSGSSVFGLFADRARAENARAELSGTWPVHALDLRAAAGGRS